MPVGRSSVTPGAESVGRMTVGAVGATVVVELETYQELVDVFEATGEEGV